MGCFTSSTQCIRAPLPSPALPFSPLAWLSQRADSSLFSNNHVFSLRCTKSIICFVNLHSWLLFRQTKWQNLRPSNVLFWWVTMILSLKYRNYLESGEIHFQQDWKWEFLLYLKAMIPKDVSFEWHSGLFQSWFIEELSNKQNLLIRECRALLITALLGMLL